MFDTVLRCWIDLTYLELLSQQMPFHRLEIWLSGDSIRKRTKNSAKSPNWKRGMCWPVSLVADTTVIIDTLRQHNVSRFVNFPHWSKKCNSVNAWNEMQPNYLMRPLIKHYDQLFTFRSPKFQCRGVAIKRHQRRHNRSSFALRNEIMLMDWTCAFIASFWI